MLFIRLRNHEIDRFPEDLVLFSISTQELQRRGIDILYNTESGIVETNFDNTEDVCFEIPSFVGILSHVF